MDDKYTIAIVSKIPERIVELLENANYNVIYAPETNQDTFSQTIKEAHGVIMRTNVEATREIIESAPKLKLIIRPGAGLNNVDMMSATERGVYVLATPGINADAVTEWEFEQLKKMMNYLGNHDDLCSKSQMSMLDGIKNSISRPNPEKTIMICGLGHVGSEAVKMAKEHGFKIIGYDPYINRDQARPMVDEFSLDKFEALEKADIISIHLPHNKETIDFIAEKEFRRMRQGAIITNTARGGIVNESDLVKALESGRLGGAIIDVYDIEPEFVGKDYPLVKAAKKLGQRGIPLYLSRHVAGTRNDVLESMVDQSVYLVDRFFKEGIAENCANFPVRTKQDRIINFDKDVIELLISAEKIGERIGSEINFKDDEKVEYLGISYNYDSKNIRFTYQGILSGAIPSLGYRFEFKRRISALEDNNLVEVEEFVGFRNHQSDDIVRVYLITNNRRSFEVGLKQDKNTIYLDTYDKIKYQPDYNTAVPFLRFNKP